MKEKLKELREIIEWLEENIEDIEPSLNIFCYVDMPSPHITLRYFDSREDDNLDVIDTISFNIYSDRIVCKIELDEFIEYINLDPDVDRIVDVDSSKIIKKTIEKSPLAINKEFEYFADLALHSERAWRKKYE